MPSASHELHELMFNWFGDAIDSEGPMAFLESHGFKLRQDWHWEPPVPAHTCSYYEWQCIIFLIEEWDFGGLVNSVSH